MQQLLPRGYSVSEDTRIKNLIAQGNRWQIYLTNQNTYILAATSDLIEFWIEECEAPAGLFSDVEKYNCSILRSSGKYLISSLGNGPYPEDIGQIEAFSVAFKRAVEKFPTKSLQDSIYVEEYSIILPTDNSKEAVDIGLIYGQWVTGGVSVSIKSFARASQIMSWLPSSALADAAGKAGFTILSEDEKSDAKLIVDENKNLSGPNQEKGEFTLVGRPDLEEFFNENIIDIVLHQEEYSKMGIDFPGATILHGLPGCGKTYAVDRLSEYLGWPRFDIDSNTIASPFIHDTSKKIAEVFQTAIKAAPSILVIDEMEAFLTDRGAFGSGTHHVEEVAEFLRRIPEAISQKVLIFAMTNKIDSIDQAILRRGRFDHIIEVKMACAEEIESLLNYKFSELPVEKDVSVKEIAKKLDGHPMSDIAFVLREAGRFAVKQRLKSISKECFEKALESLPKGETRRKIGFNAE